jgi:hypothetical protein
MDCAFAKVDNNWKCPVCGRVIPAVDDTPPVRRCGKTPLDPYVQDCEFEKLETGAWKCKFCDFLLSAAWATPPHRNCPVATEKAREAGGVVKLAAKPCSKCPENKTGTEIKQRLERLKNENKGVD